MSGSKQVVVTGMGVCSSVGRGVQAFWDSLAAGRSGLAPISSFDATGLRSRIAGEVDDFDAEALLDRKQVRRTARFTQLALVAAKEAIAQAELGRGVVQEDVAVILGSGIGGIDTYEHEHEVFLERGPGKHHPLTIPLVLPNMAAGALAKEFGFLGLNICVSTACAAGANSIGSALDLIRQGRADVVLAGSTESTISRFCVDGYCQLRALSTRNESPTTASRPFSLDRDGFVLAEGAGILVLESLEHAKARGATILAELAGYGAASDAYHLTAPDPDGRGAIRSMRAALNDAGLNPEDISVVNAHGTSTKLGDAAETRSLKAVLGHHAAKIPVHSTKSMTGHGLGASGAVEAVASILTLQHQTIHPTINLETPDPECDLDYVPEGAREAEVRTVMSNSFGFGGHSAVLIFRQFS
jgi:3-oxoacyl-[acyl-carrier-protein] synthase II